VLKTLHAALVVYPGITRQSAIISGDSSPRLQFTAKPRDVIAVVVGFLETAQTESFALCCQLHHFHVNLNLMWLATYVLIMVSIAKLISNTIHTLELLATHI